MKISEAIQQLEEIKEKYGDIPVGREYDGWECYQDQKFLVYGPDQEIGPRCRVKPFRYPYEIDSEHAAVLCDGDAK